MPLVADLPDEVEDGAEDGPGTRMLDLRKRFVGEGADMFEGGQTGFHDLDVVVREKDPPLIKASSPFGEQRPLGDSRSSLPTPEPALDGRGELEQPEHGLHGLEGDRHRVQPGRGSYAGSVALMRSNNFSNRSRVSFESLPNSARGFRRRTSAGRPWS